MPTRRSITLDSALTAESPREEDPEGTGIPLYPHQGAALRAMCAVEERVSDGIALPREGEFRAGPSRVFSRMGIYGDKPGAGKSYVMLALAMKRLTAQPPAPMMCFVNNHMHVVYTDNHIDVNTSVIIIPHGISAQWSGYLERYLPPDFPHKLIRARRDFNGITCESLLSASFRIIVLTNTMTKFFSEIAAGANVRFSRVMYDEALDLAVSERHCPPSCFVWMVTASYPELLLPEGGMATMSDGSTVECVGASSKLMVHSIRSLAFYEEPAVKMITVYSDDRFVDESLQVPVPNEFTVHCKTPVSVSVLHGNVDRQVIEALNAGDTRAAVQTLGIFSSTEDSVIAMALERLERELLSVRAKINYNENYSMSTSRYRDIERERLAERETDILRKTQSIRERVRQCTTCGICLDDFNCKTVVPCCSNAFCLQCITSWVSQQRRHSRNAPCPMCRLPLVVSGFMACSGPTDTDPVQPEPAAPQDYEQGGVNLSRANDKLQNLRILLDSINPNAHDRRLLIFSAYDTVLEADISSMLTQLRISFGMIKRNAVTINSVVQRFNTGLTKVLLINSKHYGSGMNLQAATDVVLMHNLGCSNARRQVVGRAQRGSRTSTLNIWSFVNDNEVQ